MLIDSRQLLANVVIKSDVCIVGTGPAGMSLARELIGQNFRVCMLESGDVDFHQKTQDLCIGKTVGDDFKTLDEMRHRQFGGLANNWGVKIGRKQTGLRHVPLDAIDFEQRPGVPYSGWPFSKSHLDPFYQRAQAVCKLSNLMYEADAWEDANSPRLPLDSTVVTTGVFQFGPKAAFLDEYRQEICNSSNITTYLNANVVEIETDETAQQVTRVRAACLQGNQFWVTAKIFILATGGVENARLLLMSNKVQKNGLGNQNDVVGRFFMDHPQVRSGLLIPFDQSTFNQTALYDLRIVHNVPVMGKFTVAEETLRREQLLNISAMMFPRIPNYHTQPELLNDKEFKTPGKNALKAVVADLRQKKLPKNLLRNIVTILFDISGLLGYRQYLLQRPLFPSPVRGGWSKLTNKDQKFFAFEVFHQTEQAPHPDNRVTLSDKLDQLGCPQTQLHWYWTATDIASVRKSQGILAAEFARAGVGNLQVELNGDLPQISHSSSHHHMGTTRMHDDPKQGVVDANCQVHGISNLFMAGSSVFPTGGYANPTLTIIALALRLADHVKEKMSNQVEPLIDQMDQLETSSISTI
jgi:choline dehydrogenase-like flavoprotein